MARARVRTCLLIANLIAAALIVSTFVWGLRGAHRFPVEAAINVAALVTILLSNAAYLWRSS